MSQYPMLIAIHRHTQYEYGSVLGALSTAYRSVLVKLDYTEVAVTVLSDSGVLPLAVRRLRLSGRNSYLDTIQISSPSSCVNFRFSVFDFLVRRLRSAGILP